MNYGKFQTLAGSLVSKFGSDAILKKATGQQKFDPITGMTERPFRQVLGKAILTHYEVEAIGSKDDLIQAGDVRIIAVLPEKPVEIKDSIVLKDTEYNIVSVKTVKPNAEDVIVYELQGRRLV